MTKSTALKIYHQFSKADSYIIGFLYDTDLYIVEVEKLFPRWIKVERSSSKNGGGKKLQLRLTKAHKEAFLRKNAIKIGNVVDLIGNKGNALEDKIYSLYGQIKTRKANEPFFKCGDININGKEVQVKFENAQIATFKTLERLQKM